MRATRHTVPVLVFGLIGLGGGTAWAEGLASSAASTASSAVSSASNSLGQSSNSSSRKTVADGDYRIIERTRVADRPDTLRLRLAPAAEPAGGPQAEGFELLLPLEVAERAGLQTGGTVHARQRSFGVEFAQGEPRRAFFLALNDEWFRDLQTTPLGL